MKRPKTKTDPIGFPFALVLIVYIMWNISFIGETLRRGGRTWSDKRNQFLVKILSYLIPTKETHDNIRSSTVEVHGKKNTPYLRFYVCLLNYVSVRNIDLSVESMLKTNLRKYIGKDSNQRSAS